MLALSVLDTAPIVEGSNARDALRNTVDLAVLADSLGYHRYWVPEHHGMRGVASSAPAVVAGRLADATQRIRVGAGGVLLPNHAPLVVAEQFGTLEVFHPGRIDLGLGRAPGGPGHVLPLLQGDRTPKPFREQIEELIGYFAGGPAVPAAGHRPEVWLLGSSPASADLAMALDLPYAFAHHLNPGGAAEATRRYSKPSLLVSVSVICADTDTRAEWLAGSTRLKVLSRVRGRRIRLPSPEDAARHAYTDDDRAEIAGRSHAVLVGSPDTVRERLQAVLDETGAGELMVTTPLYHHEDRRRSYELLSKVAADLHRTA